MKDMQEVRRRMDDIDEESLDSCAEHINPRSYYERAMTVPYDSLVGKSVMPSEEMKEALKAAFCRGGAR